MEQSREIQYLQGQLLATQLSVRALILAFPNADARRAVNEEIERCIATGLQTPTANDDMLRGMEAATKRLLAL